MGETAGIFLASILLRDAPSSVYKISMTSAVQARGEGRGGGGAGGAQFERNPKSVRRGSFSSYGKLNTYYLNLHLKLECGISKQGGN